VEEGFKELLASAHGISQFVIAAFVDVRGFSSFARFAESSEAAVFLRKAYIRILDDYFPQATFFKPTGDGLLLIVPYDEQNLDMITGEAVRASVSLVNDFPSLLDEDPMINFDVPRQIGIGIARGAVTGLMADKRVLDYSGRPLNLAARLMDLARPQGVVLDASYGKNQIPENIRDRFESEYAYIKGIAEREPLQILITPEWTTIPPNHKQPLEKTRWNIDDLGPVRLRELARREIFTYDLEAEPIDHTAIQLFAEYPDALPSGKQSDTTVNFQTFRARYEDQAGEPKAVVDFRPIVQKLRDADVRDSWNVELKLQYPVL
jgi:hypothetical protein